MNLSKKNYIMIAAIIKECTEESSSDSLIDKNEFVRKLCNYFKSDNSLFDSHKFWKAIKVVE